MTGDFTFTFGVDARAQGFCEEIARYMSSEFNIGIDEAVGRINRQWKGQTLVDCAVVYHEDEECWAKHIYYGPEAFWWLEKDPEPSPYP